LQSLRVVDLLEERYPLFDGLNLCFETREGILKHCSRTNAGLLEAAEHSYADGEGGVGQRFLKGLRPSLEAQLCNLADEIAYNAHDIDDGIRSGLITMAQLQDVPLFNDYCEQAQADHAHLRDPAQARRLMYESIRLMLSEQVFDVIAATQQAIQSAQVRTVDDVRQTAPLVLFGAEMQRRSAQLKQFLFAQLYRHPQVVHTMAQAKQVVAELFQIYCAAPQEMQAGFALRSRSPHPATWDAGPALQRSVADYIAGMTDRFASREHHRLTGLRLLPSGL
jgi:dGTPase